MHVSFYLPVLQTLIQTSKLCVARGTTAYIGREINRNMAVMQALLLMTSAVVTYGQRPSFAGSRPIGFPELQNKTTTPSGLEDKFGEGTTQRLPIEAQGDRELVDRLSKLPIDKQPFWFINWQAYEAERQKPQTYPLKPNSFIDSNFQNTNSAPLNPNPSFVNANPGIVNASPIPNNNPGNAGNTPQNNGQLPLNTTSTAEVDNRHGTQNNNDSTNTVGEIKPIGVDGSDHTSTEQKTVSQKENELDDIEVKRFVKDQIKT